jgi:hypothetical protein
MRASCFNLRTWARFPLDSRFIFVLLEYGLFDTGVTPLITFLFDQETKKK